jgi:hypothetical protein
LSIITFGVIQRTVPACAFLRHYFNTPLKRDAAGLGLPFFSGPAPPVFLLPDIFGSVWRGGLFKVMLADMLPIATIYFY